MGLPSSGKYQTEPTAGYGSGRASVRQGTGQGEGFISCAPDKEDSPNAKNSNATHVHHTYMHACTIKCRNG